MLFREGVPGGYDVNIRLSPPPDSPGQGVGLEPWPSLDRCVVKNQISLYLLDNFTKWFVLGTFSFIKYSVFVMS